MQAVHRVDLGTNFVFYRYFSFVVLFINFNINVEIAKI